MRRRRRYDDDRYGFPPYVPVAERRRKAEREAAARRKKGEDLSPVTVRGRTLADTFWGKAWCANLERYGDYANRLPRGRTYVRNGTVLDLKVETGRVKALVMGTHLYRVEVDIAPLAKGRWEALVAECAGKIGSALELLQGKLSDAVMAVITREGTGLFPTPREIRFTCSCPDYASLCKHVAAALYGVGARLDHAPELLFRLRGVDPGEMAGRAGVDAILKGTAPKADSRLDETDLSGLFGIELDDLPAPPAAPRGKGKPAAAPTPAPTDAPAVGTPARPRGRPRRSVAAPAPAPESVPAPRPARPRGRPRRGEAAPAPPPTITARELTGQGVPHPRIQQWLAAGVLRRTDRRGVYETTPRLAPALAAYRKAGRR
ncbi:MAG: SWIM zinc finger family protein [Acidobacteria bacterium]|nr:SWIM zinc finger family protein [Acidobacteriota bacterium]